MQGSHFHLPIYRMPVETFLERGEKSVADSSHYPYTKTQKIIVNLPRLEDFVLVMGMRVQALVHS